MPDCEWRGVMFVTGNNIHLVGDLTRRFLTCSMDANVEKPELRKFKFDPVERVLDDRGSYIAAAIIIAKAWVAAEKPINENTEPLAGFGEWSRAVRFPLIWLGEEDPVKSMEEARADDPERSSALELIEQWREHLEAERLYRVREIIDVAKETRLAASIGVGMPDWERVRPDFFELLVANATGSRKGEIDPIRLGKWLQRLRGQVYDGWKIERGSREETHGARWMLKSSQVEG
jgi:putative DNA primase/helicase